MLTKNKHSLSLLSLLFVIIVISSVLDCAICQPDKIEILNVEISPKVAEIGQNVKVTANIRNFGKQKKTCDVKACFGDYVVEELNGITIPPQDNYALMFSMNTSSLSEGKYPVEVIIEEETDGQKTFDLGIVSVGQEIVGEEVSDQEISAGTDLLYLIPIVPIGAVVSFVVWKKRKSNEEEDKTTKEMLPELLNEVLNFEEKVEGKAAQNSNSSCGKEYIR
jgi:hypothetical protein